LGPRVKITDGVVSQDADIWIQREQARAQAIAQLVKVNDLIKTFGWTP